MTSKQNGPISNVPIWPQPSMMDGTGGLEWGGVGDSGFNCWITKEINHLNVKDH